MQPSTDLTTARILAAFTEEVAERHGTVTDTFDDGRRLIARSVLPRIETLRPGDTFQGGVALRAEGSQICLHPYLFRQICRNGAIMAQTLATRRVEDLYLHEPAETVCLIREAFESCCAEDVFTGAVHHMRTASEVAADQQLNLLHFLSRLPGQSIGQFLPDILRRFFRDRDSSRFGLINAVTSVARDVRDPERRWNLEELGGEIIVGMFPASPPQRGMSAKARRRDTLALTDA